MQLVFLIIGVIILLILISAVKINPFLALVTTSIFVGIIGGMSPASCLRSILTGIGDTLGSLLLILTFGAMIGKLIEESGAALSITQNLSNFFGEKHMQVVFIVTGFLVGLPMIYNASFLVLIPLAYAYSASSKRSLLYFGIPMSATLSIAHGYLPPHPAPTTVCTLYEAQINTTLVWGLAASVPAIILAGPLLSKIFKNIYVLPPKEYIQNEMSNENLPSFWISALTALLPLLLMLTSVATSSFGNLQEGSSTNSLVTFLGDPNIALMITAVAACYTLGIRRGRNIPDIMKSLEKSVSNIAIILLVIAGGGAFKQVLIDSGVADFIKDLVMSFHFNPILMAWIIAALMRLAVGSATVAAITAAGIMLSVVRTDAMSAEIMVLATCSGSLMFSHFNDIGFWMFKEYYGVSIKQTFMIWTLMESIVAVVGLATSLILAQIGI